MTSNPESRFKLESVVGATNSLLAELGPDPGRSLEAIGGRAGELLKCECVVYGCLEEGSGAVLIRYAYNLPQSAAAACELAREIVGRIICTAGREPVCSFSLPETGPGAEAPAGPLFKSVLGCPLRLGGGSAAALVALDSRPPEGVAERSGHSDHNGCGDKDHACPAERWLFQRQDAGKQRQGEEQSADELKGLAE